MEVAVQWLTALVNAILLGGKMSKPIDNYHLADCDCDSCCTDQGITNLNSENEQEDFAEQLNDLIAPVTRAWTDPEILRVEVSPGAIKDDEIEVMATIKLRRKGSNNASNRPNK